MGLIDDIWAYLTSIGSHWWVLLGVLEGGALLAERFADWRISRRWYLGVAMGFLVIAPFQAWQEIRPRPSLRAIPDEWDFKQWATEFATAERDSKHPIPSASDKRFREANDTATEVYRTFHTELLKGFSAYREETTGNLYLDLPPIPRSIFDVDAAQYRGAATFSRHCSWLIRMRAPESGSQVGPTFLIEFMDGDGHILGASGVGSFNFQFDFARTMVTVYATGNVEPIVRDLAVAVRPSDFSRLSAQIVRTLLEHQIRNCRVK